MSPTEDEPHDAHREAAGVGVNLLTLAAQASTPAFHIQLGRSLGTAGYGLYTTATSLVDVVSVFTLFGMDSVLLRRASIARDRKDEGAALDAVANALRVVLASGLFAGLVVALGAPWIAHWQHQPRLVTPLRALVVVPIAYHAASMFLLATQARMVMKFDFWTRGIFQPLALLGATGLALHLGGGLGWACVAVASAHSLTAILAGTFYGTLYSAPATLRRLVSLPYDPSVLRAGLPLLAMSLVAALRGRIDGILVQYYRGPEAAGAFNACLPYAATLFQLRAAFYPVIAANIPAMIERRDTAGLNAMLRRQTRWVALLAVPVFVLLAGFGDALLALHGRGFVRAHAAMGVLSFGYLLSSLSLGSYALPLSGNARFNVYAGLTSVAVQLVVPSLLIPRFGLVGAAGSFVLALLVSEAICLTFARARTGAQGLSLALLKPAAAGAAALVVGLVTSAAAAHRGVGFLASHAAGVGVAAVVYVAGVLALGLDPDDRAVAVGVAKRLRDVVVRAMGGDA